MGAVALVAFGVLFLRLWSLQVLAATKYRSQAQDNQVRQIALEAPRGPILDSHGRRLVVNTVSNAVLVWPADLPKGKALNGELWQLAKVLDTKPRDIKAALAAHRNDGPIATTPVTLKVGISSDQAAYIYEHSAQFNGVEIKPTYLRYYNSEGLLAQTLGYVGRIDAGRVQGAAQAEGRRRAPLPARRPDRSGGRRVRVRPVPARPAGHGPGDRRLERPADEPAPPDEGRRSPATPSGSRSTSSSSARPRTRSTTGSSSRAGRRTAGLRTAARSSRWTRTPARSWRWRRTRPTSRGSGSTARRTG